MNKSTMDGGVPIKKIEKININHEEDGRALKKIKKKKQKKGLLQNHILSMQCSV